MPHPVAARACATTVAALILLLGAAGCRPAGAVLSGGEADWAAVNEAVVPAVVRLKVTTCDGVGYGSGFFAGPTAIVSNEHVVADALELEVDAPAALGVMAGAQVATDGSDLSVIASPVPADRTLPLANRDPVPGDRIEVIGYPHGGEVTVSSGRVIEVVDGARHGVDGPVLYSDVKVRRGNSGGPMINSRGEVVGVVMAVEYAEGRGMAVPVSVLHRVLAEPKQPVSAEATC